MKLGIMQGRLSPPVDGKIQEFPPRWDREFFLVRKLGLSHMEWIVTELVNPLFTRTEALVGLPISSVCMDFLLREFRQSQLDMLIERTCLACEKVGIRRITVPLLEEATISMKLNAAVNKWCKIIDAYPSIDFCFELDVSIKTTECFLQEVPRASLTYDTGNINALGIDGAQYIEALLPWIHNVHLKYRPYKGPTMRLAWDRKQHFHSIDTALRTYEGPYTMQMARGEAGKEEETVMEDKRYFESIFA